MKYVIERKYGEDWDCCEYDDTNNVVLYDTKKEAKKSLDEHITDVNEAFMHGDVNDPYCDDMKIVCVRKVKKKNLNIIRSYLNNNSALNIFGLVNISIIRNMLTTECNHTNIEIMEAVISLFDNQVVGGVQFIGNTTRSPRNKASNKNKQVSHVCPLCGSKNIVCDANARWSIIDQEWKLNTLFPSCSCLDCNADDFIYNII